MKNRLPLVVFAVATLTALTACTDVNTPHALPPTSSEAPRVTTPVGEQVPTDFVAAALEALPDMDPATVYESAQFYCITLTNISGNQDEAASLLLNEIGLTADQAKRFMPLAVDSVCPEWGDEYDAWVLGGGPDLL